MYLIKTSKCNRSQGEEKRNINSFENWKKDISIGGWNRGLYARGCRKKGRGGKDSVTIENRYYRGKERAKALTTGYWDTLEHGQVEWSRSK